MQYGPFSKIKAPSQATYFRIDTPRPAEQASSSTDVAAALEASLRAERDAVAEREKNAEAMMHGQSFNIAERRRDEGMAKVVAEMLMQHVPQSMGGS